MKKEKKNNMWYIVEKCVIFFFSKKNPQFVKSEIGIIVIIIYIGRNFICIIPIFGRDTE